jgi:hypothetical protein
LDKPGVAHSGKGRAAPSPACGPTSARFSLRRRLRLFRSLGRLLRGVRSFAAPDAGLQRRHQVDDIADRLLLGSGDRQALLLLVEQFLQRSLVVIFEFFQLEMAGLCSTMCLVKSISLVTLTTLP